MYKLFFIAKNNIKKQKGDMITFFILTFLSAFLIFNCGSVLSGMGMVMDKRFEEINGAHELLFVRDTAPENECAKKAFENNKHIIEYESSPLMDVYADYRNKNEKEWKEYEFFVEDYAQEKNLMKVLSKDLDVDKLSDDDIIVPFYLKNRYAIGDTLELRINDTVYDFNVVGYSEDPYFSSSINITVYYTYMSGKMIDKILEENPDKAIARVVYKGKIDESELAPAVSNVVEYIYSFGKKQDYFTTSELEKEITETYKDYIAPYNEEDPAAGYTGFLGVNWQMMRGGSQFIPMIVMAVVFLFAVLILVIAIVIISFSIKNFIQRNMKNTGILEASGYTVKELRGALSVEIVMVAFLGAVLGVLIAIFTAGQFGTLVSSVLGITWNQPVNYTLSVAVVIILTLLILLVSRFSSRVYKKISVLDALRGGINAHNFKRNFFPFEKTYLPIPLVLSLKETFGEAGRNLVMIVIVVVLTLSTLLGFGLMDNFGRNPDTLIKIMGIDAGTMLVEGNEDVEDELNELEGVESVLSQIGFEPVASHKDVSENVYTYGFRDISKRPNLVLIEGRIAKHDNEMIVTTGVAEDLSVGIGDVVTIKYGDKSADYIITGIDQRMERMGRSISITFDGAKRLLPAIPTVQYKITAKEGVTYDDLDKEIKELEKSKDIEFGGKMDMVKNLSGTIESVSNAMKMLCILISIITVLVVIFVEALVIRAKIVREWRGLGVNKALGMTSVQLILQIMMTNVPAILVGTFVGAFLSESFGSKVCVASFSLFGVKQIDFSIAPVWQVITIVGILVVAVVTAGLFGLKTRSLNPVNMITEE